jgi:hypothetical protein
MDLMEKYLGEARFSSGHYGFNSKGEMFGDTGSIYILDDLGGEIDHIGFGDFETKFPIKLGGGVGEVKVAYIRADGSKDGREFVDAGFVGRPHIIRFSGANNDKKAAQELGKLYGKAGAKLVKI